MKAKILKRTVVSGQRVDPKTLKGPIDISPEDMRYLFKRGLALPADAKAREVCGVKADKESAKSATVE